MNENYKKIVDLSNKIINKPLDRYTCPICSNNFLNIYIIPIEGVENKVEICLICNICSFKHYILKIVD